MPNTFRRGPAPQPAAVRPLGRRPSCESGAASIEYDKMTRSSVGSLHPRSYVTSVLHLAPLSDDDAQPMGVASSNEVVSVLAERDQVALGARQEIRGVPEHSERE